MTIAFVFPGQGSQMVGMGRDLYEASPAARAIYDLADAILHMPLSRLCFEGPEEVLTATENAQPALLTTSIALLAALAEYWHESIVAEARPAFAGMSPWTSFVVHRAAFVAGHSLGEYTALVAAGALDFMTALRLVRRRGELMADAHEGLMAAVLGADEAVLEAACATASHDRELVVVANYNAPGQLVISGSVAAVERASTLAKELGAKRAIPLKVSAAFHSPLMRAAAEELQHDLAAARFTDAHVPVVANVTSEPLIGAESLRAELIAQVTSPVRWIASVQHMAAAGVETIVEVGPGAVLTGLARRIAPGIRLVNVADLAGVHAYTDRWSRVRAMNDS